MGMKKCTKMKTSRRIFFPLGRPIKEEAGLETRFKIWREIADALGGHHTTEKCHDKWAYLRRRYREEVPAKNRMGPIDLVTGIHFYTTWYPCVFDMDAISSHGTCISRFRVKLA